MAGPRSPRRTIAVVTGSRADFGLLAPVCAAIDNHPRLNLQLIAAGAHLTAHTWRDIETAGFTIAHRVRMQKPHTTGRAADAQALGRGITGFSLAFQSITPDCVLILGDRIEAFAAASAAAVAGFPLAHIHGGDRAEGVADESMRHAISKLAHFHFPATAASRRRLLRMGEPSDRIHRVGSPAIDNLRDTTPAEDAPNLIVLQHPVGAAFEQERRWMRATLAATTPRATNTNAPHTNANTNTGDPPQRLVMAPNADPGSDGIRAAIADEGIEPIEHLPRQRWLALLAGADVIVGNSSAGLIEAAALRTPCVNVGPRQAGREKPRSVIDCDYGKRNVQAALRRALELDLRRMRHPYGDGRAGQRIADHLATAPLPTTPDALRKRNTY